MDKPLLRVDFNEMVKQDLVLLSKTDEALDADGNAIKLFEGLRVCLFMDDLDKAGRIDNLLAEGVVERNDESSLWAKNVKWCCPIDTNGVRNESDIVKRVRSI